MSYVTHTVQTFPGPSPLLDSVLPQPSSASCPAVKVGIRLVSLATQKLFEPRGDTTSYPFLENNCTNKMATNSQEDPKPDRAAFDDFFESLGKKAEHLTIDERNGTKDPTSNGTASIDSRYQGGRRRRK
jgi:hypothetical protein